MCRSVEMRIPDFAAITLKLLFARLTFPASAFDGARNFSSFFLNYLEFVNTRVSYSSQFENRTRLHTYTMVCYVNGTYILSMVCTIIVLQCSVEWRKVGIDVWYAETGRFIILSLSQVFTKGLCLSLPKASYATDPPPQPSFHSSEL